MTPVTEQRNPATNNFDQLSIGDAIRTMRHVEGEILYGCDGATGLISVAEEISALADRIVDDIRGGRINRLCLSGSGTSGRLCYITSVLCQQIFGTEVVQYNINGGLSAFVKSRVGIEDSFTKGTEEIARLSEDECSSALIAISCGLSAPYVAGQLGSAVERLRGPVVAMGFNPRYMARREVRARDHISFSQTLDACSAYPHFSVLDPVVGPEAIAGSVRLKAGSGTLITLFTLAACVHRKLSSETFDSRLYVRQLLSDAVEAIDLFYEWNSELMEEILSHSIASVRAGSSVHLLSDSAYGLLLVADCAECPPTFGARYDEFIGYCPISAFGLGHDARIDRTVGEPIPVRDGYGTNFDSSSDEGMRLKIGQSTSLWSDIRRSERLHLALSKAPGSPRIASNLVARMASMKSQDFGEFYNFVQMKAFLNAVSTVTFSLTGKVYKNVMVDLRISNAKLFDRSVLIVSELCGKSMSEARTAILQSMYRSRDIGEFVDRPILEHVYVASQLERVIPLAIALINNPALSIEKALAGIGSGHSSSEVDASLGRANA